MLQDAYRIWSEKAPLWERQRETLEEKLEFMIDKQRIHDLVHEYALATDAKSWDVHQKLYHEDIERIMTGTLDETVHGRDNLIALHINPALPHKEDMTTKKRDFARIEGLEIRHLIGSLMTRVSDDNQEAWAICHYQMALVGRENDAWEHGRHEGTYVFSFVKTEGFWQFKQHLIWTNNAINPMFSVQTPAR
jgi:hypothetical protein